MKGKVITVNSRGFVAVQTDGGITVMELLGGYEVEEGDVISGDLENHGGESVCNETQMEDMEVYIQGVHCTPQSAKQLLS